MKAGPSATLVSIEPPWAQMTVSLTASPPSLPTSTLHRVSPPSSLAGRPSCFIWRGMRRVAAKKDRLRLPGLEAGQDGQEIGGLVGGELLAHQGQSLLFGILG